MLSPIFLKDLRNCFSNSLFVYKAISVLCRFELDRTVVGGAVEEGYVLLNVVE